LEATRSHQKTKMLQSQMQSKIGLAAPWFSFTEQLDRRKAIPFEAQRSGAILNRPDDIQIRNDWPRFTQSVLFILSRTNPLN
jgi:hypothetical protein